MLELYGLNNTEQSKDYSKYKLRGITNTQKFSGRLRPSAQIAENMRIVQESQKLSRNAYIGQYNTETATQRAFRQQKSSLTHGNMESIKEGDTSATSAKRDPSYARLLHTNQDASSSSITAAQSVRSLPKL